MKSNIMLVFFVVLSFVYDHVLATGIEYCQDLRPQHTLDIKEIMGMWYGVEVIPHQVPQQGETDYDSCPVIHLSELRPGEEYLRPGDYGYNWNTGGRSDYAIDTFGYQSNRDGYIYRDNERNFGNHYGGSSRDFDDREFRHIRLYWVESGNNAEYLLKFNTTRRGFWISSSAHDPAQSSIQSSSYNEFAGTVQVIKAVNDHLVLTFCQRLPKSELFTVILSREPQQLGRQVINSIHSLLQRKSLSTSAVRRVCTNGTNNTKISITSVSLFTLLSMLVYFGIGKI